jgi:beta-lactam-binding protein with PASTA domain
MTVDEALEAARAFEEATGVNLSVLTGTTITSDPAYLDRVISQKPAVGATVTGQASVTIFIGQLDPESG